MEWLVDALWFWTRWIATLSPIFDSSFLFFFILNFSHKPAFRNVPRIVPADMVIFKSELMKRLILIAFLNFMLDRSCKSLEFSAKFYWPINSQFANKNIFFFNLYISTMFFFISLQKICFHLSEINISQNFSKHSMFLLISARNS